MSNLNPTAPGRTREASGNLGGLLAVCLCFVLSGVAALVYQTVWARQFALAFGTSELAIAAVLAAYMGGLALGAWYIERRLGQIRRALLWYAAIEAGIAAAAMLLVPAGLRLAELWLVSAFGGQPEPPGAALGGASMFYLAAAFLVLLLPTTLMGATLPLLARYAVHSERQIGGRIGLLYACNTIGAVGGALLGALVLLPALGLTKTVWVAAAVNVAVALMALAMARLWSDGGSAARAAPEDARPVSMDVFRAGISAAWVLPLMFVSGAVSFLHEVLWTRMLSHVLGSSIYAFGVMLAGFLAGIACGGGLGALLARQREGAARWLAISELAAAVAAVGAWAALQGVSPEIASQEQRIVFGFGLLFPLAFAIGATYPLAVRVLSRGVHDAARASARVYSWNTVGAILGAVAGGFLIVPALRYEGAVRLAVLASCGLALFACFALFRPGRRFAVALTIPAAALAILFAPGRPDALLRYSPLRDGGAGELLYYDVGRSAAVVTLRLGDQLTVSTSGLPEAGIDIRGTIPRMYGEAWMTPLAILARPGLHDLLVVGFGGGRVLELLPPSVRQVDVIELEDKVIDANRQLTDLGLRDPLHDPLANPRINLVVNDARGALQLSTKQYDAIVSQPSHPWTAGASHLYTREFMQQARAHLREGGVFVQWMNVEFLDESLLRSLIATLNSVFPEVRTYRPTPLTLLFLGSDAPIEPESDIATVRATLAAASGAFGRVGLNAPEDLVASLVLDNDGNRAFGAGAAVITDDTNRFAVASLYDSAASIGAESLGRLLMPYDPLLDADSFVYRELRNDLAFDYIARRLQAFVLADDSSRERLRLFANRFDGSDLQDYVRSLAEYDPGQPDEARRVLSEGVRLHPGNSLLREALAASAVASMRFPWQGGAPVAFAEAADPVVAEAARRAASGEWQQVSELESELSQVPWTSLWNGQAIRLRIEARVRAADGASVDADGIELIDRLSLFEADPQLFLLRALSAGDEAHVLTESLFRYSLAILQGLVASEEVPRGAFALARERFAVLAAGEGVYPYHHVEVQNAVAAAASLIGPD